MKKKVLILNADSFIETMLYTKFKEEQDFWVIGTYNGSKKYDELVKLNVEDLIEVKTFMEHFRPDVVIWSEIRKLITKENINEGLFNITSNMNKTSKIVLIENKEQTYAESVMKKHGNYIVIKSLVAKTESVFSENVVRLVKINYNGIMDLSNKGSLLF